MPTQNLLFDTVADVDDEDRVGNSLLQFWKLRFGHKAKLFSDYEHTFVYRTLQRFGQYFEVEVQARFLSWNLVSI